MAIALATQVVTYPSFASQIPAGITPLTCTNDPNTFPNESLCDGRILHQSTITIRENSAQSIYHSMQSRFNGRFLSNSLSLGRLTRGARRLTTRLRSSPSTSRPLTRRTRSALPRASALCRFSTARTPSARTLFTTRLSLRSSTVWLVNFSAAGRSTAFTC